MLFLRLGPSNPDQKIHGTRPPKVFPRWGPLANGGRVSFKGAAMGFIYIPANIIEKHWAGLTPKEKSLLCTIASHFPTCYRSRTGLMSLSGIRCFKAYRKAIHKLIELRLIKEKNRIGKTSVFTPGKEFEKEQPQAFLPWGREEKNETKEGGTPGVFTLGSGGDPRRFYPGDPRRFYPGEVYREVNKETDGAPKGGRAGSLGDPIMFFEKPKEEKAGPNGFDKKAAKYLINAVRKKKNIRIHYNPNKWADEIRKLRQSINSPDPEGRVKAALQWYAQNIGAKYTPVCYSAGGFRAKFLAIESAMERAGDAPAGLAISEKAKEVAERAAARGWGKTPKADLEACAQLSMDRYAEFRKRLGALKKIETNGDKKRARTIERFREIAKCLDAHWGPPVTFADQWMELLWKRTHNWKDWDGNVIRLAFDPGDEKWHAIGRQIAGEYCGRPDEWEKLLKEIDSI